jgi:hypothetical protein
LQTAGIPTKFELQAEQGFTLLVGGTCDLKLPERDDLGVRELNRLVSYIAMVECVKGVQTSRAKYQS